jgi:hypothetical protein
MTDWDFGGADAEYSESEDLADIYTCDVCGEDFEPGHPDDNVCDDCCEKEEP